MEAVVIFQAATISKSIASYLGFIDSVSSDVKKLLHQSFESGIKNLEYAQSASEANQKLYIQKALGDFISASSVEKDENLISSYLGIAMCQYLLGDITNARISLHKISSVTLSKLATTKAAAVDMTVGVAYKYLIPIGNPWGIDVVELRVSSFEEYKRKALSVII